MKVISSDFKLGILGGGQLGKMLIQKASQWDVACYVLDPNPNCPAAFISHGNEVGSFNDYDDVMRFGADKDVLTIEIENVNVDALRELQKQGKKVFPSPDVISTIKDKGLQKAFYLEHGIPSSEFKHYIDHNALMSDIEIGTLSLPFVQKACREGYDGRGVAVIRTKEDFSKILQTECIAEQLVDIDKEISVIVSRNEKGEMAAFEPVEMEFSDEANLVEILIAPARLDQSVVETAMSLGKKVAEQLNMVGLLAVEMFLTKAGDVLVNESAPRPHNSGHHTIEANIASQYEQHLRAILGQPLGSVEARCPSVMVNVLGSPGHEGDVVYRNLEEVMTTSGAYLHIYGKRQTKPYRKMGHLTLLGGEMEALIREGKRLKNLLKVEAE